MSHRSRWALGLLTAGALTFGAGLTFSQEAKPDGAKDATKQDGKKKPKHTNRLAKEASPYLRQHAHNPVDWYPWGEEAFAKAKKEKKLVFLSIGYATCHWCHVMERESFENEEVAKYLNEHFVAIKVDREERPDIDEIYMTAIQVATGSGGWPLSVFLTPEAKPLPVLPQFRRRWGSALTGGTYFPQPARFGRKSFLDELKVRQDIWSKYHDRLLKDAASFSEVVVKAVTQQKRAEGFVPSKVLLKGKQALLDAFDKSAGGFPGDARRNPTRFPMPHLSSFLLRFHHRYQDPQAIYMVKKTLESIRRGGLRDHLAGGFHRYSVDAQWEIPHFEKMLYDQAGLVRAFVEGWQVTQDPAYAAVARETMEFVLRSMRDPKGGFTSAWDADSEGVEGKFYLWTRAQVDALLGADAPLFADRYSVTKEGNFHELPGKNHTHLQLGMRRPALATKHKLSVAQAEERLGKARAKLLAARAKRIPPLHDDKLLVDWNGMMIGSAALAGRALGEPRYTRAAEEAAEFILKTLRTKDGRLLHRYRAGQAGIAGMLEDYAFFVWGLLELYESTFAPRWLAAAKGLTATMIADFWDSKQGGFFQVDKRSKLLARPKPTYDGAIPAGNSVAALVLGRLGTLLGARGLRQKSAETLRWYSQLLLHSGGRAASVGLQALDFLHGPTREVVISGDPKAAGTQAMLKALRKRFLPRTVVILRPPGEAKELSALIPFVKGQTPVDTKPTAYVCENYACKAPVTTVEALVKLIDARPETGDREKRRPNPLAKPGDPGNKQRDRR